MSTMGDIMSTVGRYLEYHGGVQYHGGYHDKCGDILSTLGVFSTVRGIMINVGDILSTVGVFSTVGDIMMHVGDIMSTMGCSVLWGKIFCYLSTPTVLMISPQYLNFKGWYPPTVLKGKESTMAMFSLCSTEMVNDKKLTL